MQATFSQDTFAGFGPVRTSKKSASGLESVSDDRLVDMFRAGDQHALDALMRRYERPITRLAIRLSRNQDEAQDIAAEARLRICMNFHTVKQAITLPAWINRIVVNAYINMRRHAKRRPSVSLEELHEKAGDAIFQSEAAGIQSPQGYVEANERKELLSQAIQSLPEFQRTLVTMFHNEGLTYEEIASILRIPIGTIKSRLNRARAALRETLRPHMSTLVN